MKCKLWIFFSLLPALAFSQSDYNHFFKNGAMRFDYYFGGNSNETIVYPAGIKAEPYWGGPKNNLDEDPGYGNFRFRINDVKTDSLIFTKGFCTLFQEWQTTAEAKNTSRIFSQAAIFPFPKRKVRLEIDARQRDGNFKTIYTTEIDPGNYFINRDKTFPYPYEKILDNGKPDKKVDIAIVAEGYTKNEMDKFIDDVKRLTDYLFSTSPFKEEKENFNVYAIKSESLESGTDIPGEHIYKNTRFNSSFYTFDLDRYLTATDIKNIYDVTSVVPWDQVYVLVNTERYGGGGIYNYVTVCTSNHMNSEKVFVHEFGHGFAGLGDEYYTSEVAYEDFYNLKTEPWEPNLTTLVDFSSKWENLIPDSVPVPTPRKNRYINTVGAFEGGGYMAKGIYSPMMDCRMKSNNTDKFCPVCQKAIKKMIQYYTQ